MHSIITKYKGNNRLMALNLDMSKTYDRVELDSLKAVILKLGFNNTMVQQIMACVYSVSYSVMVNSFPQTFFKPSRSIRQGDSLSPYLFILCAEALSFLFTQAKRKGWITSMLMGQGPHKVNHLFFVNDSLFFLLS